MSSTAQKFVCEMSLVTRLSTSLASCVIPLFAKRHGKRPKLVGSSFLVSAGEAVFLVSAAHVLDEISHLHFYIAPGTIRKLTGHLLQTKLPSNGRRTSDRLDIGILRLEGPGLPPYPEVGKNAIPISELHPSALPRDDKQYLVIGFPETKSRVNPAALQITSEPVSFRNISAPRSKYEELHVADESHIVLPLDLRHTLGANAEVQSFPKPSGLSGSPVWLLVDKHEQNPLPYFPVVGVAIEYHKESKALVATDIKIAVKLINAAV